MSTLTYQQYVDLINKRIIRPLIKIEWLRPEDESVYNTFIGKPLNGSNITISNSNGCRRSVTIVLDNTKGIYFPNPNTGMVWINNKFQLSVGLEDENGNNIFFKQGIFCINGNDPEIKSEINGNSTITIKASDKWCMLQNPIGKIIQIAKNESITLEIYSLLKSDDINDKKVPLITAFPNDRNPYTLKWSPQDTYEKIIKDLANTYSRDVYYNQIGQLVYEEFQDISIIETQWDFATETCEYTGATRIFKNSELFNEVVVTSNGINNQTFIATARDIDLSSNTNIINNPIHRYSIEDDKIPSQDLCQQRAEYELSKRKRLQEQVSMNCICLPHLTVNKGITLTDKKLNLYRARFAIQSIDMPLDMQSAMTITAFKYNDGDDFQDRNPDTSNALNS